MDKIITVFSYIQHYVFRSSTKSEEAHKADSNQAENSCSEQEACPVWKESEPSQGSNFGRDSLESASSSITESSESRLFGDSGGINERTAFIPPKSTAKVAESKSESKELNERSWSHPLGEKFSNDKSLRHDVKKIADSKAKPVKSQVVLPLIATAQSAQETSKKNDEPKRGRGFDNGSGSSENTDSEGNGNLKRKVTEKGKDKKLFVNSDKNSNLPNILITAEKPLIHVKCHKGFPDDQAAHGPEVQLSNRACNTTTWSKDPCMAFPKLKHDLGRKDSVLSLRSSKPAPANTLVNRGKPAEGKTSRSDEAMSGNKQHHKSSRALGRWIKKRSNSVAPAPLEDLIDPPARGCQSRVAANTGQREEKRNQPLKNGKNLRTKRGKTDSQFTQNEASAQPRKTIFVKQRAENVSSLFVEDQNAERKEKAIVTGERSGGANRFNRRESLNGVDKQKCNRLVEKNGEPSRNLRGLTMDQSTLEKIFHRVTGRPSSLLGGHRSPIERPVCIGQQSIRFSNALRHSGYNNRNLPKVDHNLRTYSMKPRLHSIVELEEPMQEDFPGLSTGKKHRKLKKDEGVWRESASSRGGILFERPTPAETPQHRPTYQQALASEVRPAKSRHRRRLTPISSQASDREIFSESNEGEFDFLF